MTFLIFVLSLGYYVASSGDSKDYQRLLEDSATLKEGNDTLRAENDALRETIVGLRRDHRVIERRIRDDLGKVRRDEIMILLNQPERR